MEHIPVADIEIISVTPDKAGFTLEGRGEDRANYRLRLDLEVPVDSRTRAVLGEMLSQSKWRLWRKASTPNMQHAKHLGRSADKVAPAD